MNEKLLRLRVSWGRFCATDIIVDVEREQILYQEMVWDGGVSICPHTDPLLYVCCDYAGATGG